MRLNRQSIVRSSWACRIGLTSLLLGASAIASTMAWASSPTGLVDVTRVHPDQVRLQGLPGIEVESIKGVETLSDWETLDTQHLTLRVNHTKLYLLKLRAPCHRLRGAQLVGISMTNQEIWADFDHVAADGYECRIDTITRLGRKRS